MAKCKDHTNCRKVKTVNHILAFVDCPWCGYSVNVSNPNAWCANCYVKYKVVDGFAHFSKDFERSMAEHWAIAIAKAGGMKIGTLDKE